MATIGKKRRYPTASSPNESEDDNGEQPAGTTSQAANKRRGSVAADFAPHRLIVSERQQMAVLKQLTAGEESNTGSQSPSSVAPPPRPSKINRRNEHGETIVHIAARKGDLKQLKKVLKAGANVNEADNAGWTPLHEAVTKNQFKAARLLLKSGANVNAPGPEGQTPLVDAVLNNNTKMAELLLNSSADPSVLDISRLNETMSRVVRRELSVLDSSDNENNDDDSISPLSPLTSENDFEHDEEKSQDKQLLHVEPADYTDRNPSPRSTSTSTRKKPYRRFRERSSQSSDSSSQSKTRTASGNTELAASATTMGKNPYDFESEEEGEIRESANEAADESQMKKKAARKSDHAKQRTQSGNSSQSTENMLLKKRLARLDLSKEQEPVKIKANVDDEHQRIPPLKIVLARAVVRGPSDAESLNLSTMDDNPTTTTVDTSPVPVSEPTSEVNEKPLASSVSIPYPDVDDKVMNPEEEPSQADLNKIKASDFSSPVGHIEPEEDEEEPSRAIAADVLDMLLEQVELNVDQTLTVLAVVEDGQMELDDDGEDDEMDDEEELETDTTIANHPLTKADKMEDEPTTATSAANAVKSSISSRRDLKPTTRTLRSHARGKMNSSASNQTSSSNPNNHGRRVSNRRRALELKPAMMNHEKERKRRTISERSRKEKDNASTTNEDVQTSSNSDDQMTDNAPMDKVSQSTGNPNDDASSCSSTGAGEGSSTSSSTIATKQTSTDLDSLPPNKRRVRERNTTVNSNTSVPPTTATDTSANSNSNSVTEHSPADSMPTRDMPVNGIKQFLEIRQQIDKRHETMLNEFVLPKVPKDFAETTMAKRNYLIAPSFTSYSINTPASMGIRRCNPPHDLDGHLADVFGKQEDERYKMKLRHQVERDKLILSHEQEVLRLYGNATRSSLNQEIPFSYCSLLKDNEVYNNPAVQLPEKERHTTVINTDGSTAELGKRGKHRWNGRSFIKWLEESNLKYKRLSCELNERQRLEVDTLYSMQRMVWSKHLPKESLNLSSSGRTSYLLNERYLPKVEINPNFWTHWETGPF